ncbi:MAG TPA: phospholipid carrier-dependent glycosyltransferase [Thermoanaerobaculia bacterium]|nr:phospholipid carrier-dependent glycosyltransferase [Thermoanaerobaculia bacterium]
MSLLPLSAILAFYGGHLLALALLALTAWVLGRLLVGSLLLVGAERVVLPATLGLAGLAHLAFLLGLAHALTRPALLLVLVAIHLLGWRAWREMLAGVAGIGRRRLALGALALLVGLPLFLLALYPPTAFDATLYHLPDARAFARAGALPFLGQLRFPVFPQLDEALFAAVLLLAGDVAVQLVQLLAILLTAGLLLAWGGAGEGEDRSRYGGLLAAAAYLGSPIVIHLGTTAYVEAGLTLFTTAALAAAWRYRQSGDCRRLALSAFFAASAAGVKYLGLFFFAVAVLLVMLPSRQEPARKRRPADLLLFAAVALMALLPVYGRILYFTGNPIFPYLPRLFGHSPWDPVTLRPLPESLAAALRQGLTTLVTLPWNVVFARGRTGSQPPFSPFLLLALPLFAVALWRDRRARPWLLVALAYTACFPLLPPDARYLLPILPLLSLALAAALDRLPLSPRGGIALAVLLLLPGGLYAIYRVALQGAPPVTSAARDHYLAARLPLYPAVAWLNREGGSDSTVYAFFAEDMTYFAQGTLLGDWHGPARFAELLPDLGDPEALWRHLRSLGVDFLLVPRDRGDLRLPESPAWSRRFRPVYADPHARVFALDGGGPTL